MVHHLEHQILQDHPQPARAQFSLHRQCGDPLHGIIGKLEADVLEIEQPLKLSDQGVLRLRHDLDQSVLVQVVQHADDRQTPDEFGNHSVADQVRGLRFFQQLDISPAGQAGFFLFVPVEAHGLAAQAPLDDPLQAHKGAAADEKDIGGIDLGKLLVRVLASALGRNVGHRPFKNLQQRLLHAFTGNIAGDRRVLVLAGNLVDFVDINDSLLGPLHVAAGGLDQLQDHVLDVLADVAGLGQRGGVDDGKGHVEQFGQCLRQQGLAGSGRSD